MTHRQFADKVLHQVPTETFMDKYVQFENALLRNEDIRHCRIGRITLKGK